MILGIGIDQIEISRFELSTCAQAWFAKRIFTAQEVAYAQSKRQQAQHLAGCFAAKEAFRKALGRGIPWQAMGITHQPSGAPQCAVNDEVATLLEARGITSMHVSITHNKGYAAAVVVLEGS